MHEPDKGQPNESKSDEACAGLALTIYVDILWILSHHGAITHYGLPFGAIIRQIGPKES